MRNLVIISLDCVRRESLSCYGMPFQSIFHKKVGLFDFFGGGFLSFFVKLVFGAALKKRSKSHTPAIDQIASQGIMFLNAFTQAPYTPAAHASLFTGLNPYSHGIRRMVGLKLNSNVLTLAQALKTQGYSTAGFLGSNALGKEYGLDRGFDLYDFSPDQLFKNFGDSMKIYQRNCKNVTSNALRWLENNKNNKFFLFVHYFDAHENDSSISYHPFWQMRKVSQIDTEIGAISKFLFNNNLYDDTVIVILSDHGNSFGEHGEIAHKEYLYDSTVRIPLILRYKKDSEKQTSLFPIGIVDIFPTLARILECNLPGDNKFDGINILTSMGNKVECSTRSIYSETALEKSSLYPEELRSMSMSLRTLKWKCVWELFSKKVELFDLQKDPNEVRDVSQLHPEIVHEFYSRLNKITPKSNDSVGSLMNEVEKKEIKNTLKSLGYL